MPTGDTVREERERRRAEQRKKNAKPPRRRVKGSRGNLHKVAVVELTEREQQLGRLYREAVR